MAQAAYDTDFKPDNDGSKDKAGKPWTGKQNIVSYGMFIGDLSRQQDAWYNILAKATVGGVSIGNNHQAFFVSTAKDMLNALQNIFTDIAEASKVEPPRSYSNVSPALSSKDSAQAIPDTAAGIHLDLKSGSSEIRFYNVSPSTHGWDIKANAKKVNFHDGNRYVLMNDGSNVFRLSDSSPLNNEFFGIVGSKNTDEWRTALVPWLTRSTTDTNIARQTNNQLKYRVRSNAQFDVRSMGDVIDSGIEAILDFSKNPKYLLTAANDGMVYLFQKTNNDATPYELKVNYMPAAMPRESATDTVAKHFKYITDPDYIVSPDKEHQYLLNGGLVVRTTDSNNPHRIFMAGNMGQAGRGAYALNIEGSNQAKEKVGVEGTTYETSVPLFETPKGDIPMGYTIGAPQIGRIAEQRLPATMNNQNKLALSTNIADVKYATFVNSGIAHPTEKANTETALYVYNTLEDQVGLGNTIKNRNKGELIQKIAIDKSVGKGGLAQATLVDVDFDGIVDVAYAGDYGGGLYRFDLRSDPGSWTAHKIFQAQANQPITAAPAVFRLENNKYVVVFGTGSDLFDADMSNMNIQSAYGIYDDLNAMPNTAPNGGVKTVSNLVKQDISEKSITGFNVRNLTNNALTEAHHGWYFNLPASERIVTKPLMALQTAIFTTRSYKTSTSATSHSNANDVCEQVTGSVEAAGNGWVMQVRVDDGGNLPDRTTWTDKSKKNHYAYINFMNETDLDESNNFLPRTAYSGYQRPNNGIVSIGAYLNHGDMRIMGNYGNSTNTNGDAGTSGVDAALLIDSSNNNPNNPNNPSNPNNPGGSNPGNGTGGGGGTGTNILISKINVSNNPDNKNKCFDSDGNFITESGSKPGFEFGLEVAGSRCKVNGGVGIRRLSWREIF